MFNGLQLSVYNFEYCHCFLQETGYPWMSTTMGRRKEILPTSRRRQNTGSRCVFVPLWKLHSLTIQFSIPLSLFLSVLARNEEFSKIAVIKKNYSSKKKTPVICGGGSAGKFS